MRVSSRDAIYLSFNDFCYKDERSIKVKWSPVTVFTEMKVNCFSVMNDNKLVFTLHMYMMLA